MSANQPLPCPNVEPSPDGPRVSPMRCCYRLFVAVTLNFAHPAQVSSMIDVLDPVHGHNVNGRKWITVHW